MPDAASTVRLAAAAAAGAVAVTSAGDGFVVAALLGVATTPLAGLAAGLAMAATAARWGSSDLGAIAGDQDVLGAAVAVGPVPAAASSALAGVAVVLLVAAAGDRSGPRLAVAVAAGAAAAGLVAGPAPTSAADLAVRAGAVVLAVGLALLASRPAVASRVPPWLPLVPAALALGCALA